MVGQGETVTCTFTNTRQGGTFVIKKATDPAGLTNTFSFGSADSPCGGGFLLTGAAGSDTFECAVVPGTYHVNELDPSPTFLLTDLSCDDADSTVDMPSREATIVVGQGETVTCTFTNTRRRTSADREAHAAGLTNTFSFGSADSPCGGGFLLTGAAGSDTFECAVVPGTYHVNELDPSPTFLLTDLSCDDADSTGDMPAREATIVVDQAEIVTCTFTNVGQGGTRDQEGVDPAGVPTIHLRLRRQPCARLPPHRSGGFGDLRLRRGPRHLRRERVRPEPELRVTDLVCDDADSTGDMPAREATIVVDQAEIVTCTFTNVGQGGDS